jgi:uncharacterized protein YggU (UPF0235/DUF167 family)
LIEEHIEVRLAPRARRDEIVALRDGVLIARVCAPPRDGEANRALCRLIARGVGVAPGRVSVIAGKTGRSKLVHVAGLDRVGVIGALGIADAAD